VVQRRSFAASIGIYVVSAIALVGCGSGGSTVGQVRETVRSYLSATTPAARCQLLTTVYRTENPGVIFSGGCQEDQQVGSAEEAARRTLHIAAVVVRGDQATVTLVSGPRRASGAGTAATPRISSLELEIDGGRWRINGFTETAQATATAG
jgi:hypothetical protein